MHPDLSFHLIIDTWNLSHLASLENILPTNACVSSIQNILMDGCLVSAQADRRPTSIPNGLELHTSANWFCHTKCAAQTSHLQCILCGGPLSETGFKWVGRVEGNSTRGGSGWADSGLENVVEAWSAGSTARLLGEVRVGGGCGRSWDNTERLRVS